MAAKPIKSLELHYTMIQFLIIHIIRPRGRALAYPGAFHSLVIFLSDIGCSLPFSDKFTSKDDKFVILNV